MIDAKERRSVIAYDIPGAFQQPEMPRMKNSKGCKGKTLMKFRGDIFTEMMCNITPEYNKENKGKGTIRKGSEINLWLY